MNQGLCTGLFFSSAGWFSITVSSGVDSVSAILVSWPNTCSTSGYRKLGPNFRTEEVLTFHSKQEDRSPEFPMLPFPHGVQGSLQAKHFSGSTQFRVSPKTPVGWSPGSLPTRSRESQNIVSLAASRQLNSWAGPSTPLFQETQWVEIRSWRERNYGILQPSSQNWVRMKLAIILSCLKAIPSIR